MEYNYESNPLQRVNKLYSTSPTSSSSSSSSSTSSSSTLPPLGGVKNKVAKQPKTGINTTCSQFATMSSSTSQIFATAASFNICQNDTVYYARETIHLLVKFLSINSSNPIFRSLYTFAPDNLSWLWSFIDWESPLDLSSVSTQSTYSPFKPVGNLVIDESELCEVNKLFLDAPLIQYKYREPLMIGDVYKFLEHVSKTEQTVVAKALFLTYFPRFKEFIDNPLQDIIQLKVLKSNQNIIKLIDETVKSLIKSRYPSIDEYKQNIKQGLNLPTYIRTLLKENNYFQENEEALANNKASEVVVATGNKNLNIKLINENVQAAAEPTSTALYSPFSIDTKVDLNPKLNRSLAANGSEEQSDINEMLMSNIDLNREVFADNVSEIEQQPAVFFPVTKTIDYMKLLEKSNRINDDLDHVSFDKKKAMLCNKFLQEKNLDSFSDARNDTNNRNINNLLMNQFYGTFDENNNNNYEIEDNLNDYKDAQLAAKCFDLVNSSSETTTADLNLATLTLPQLNHFHDQFNNNGHSSAMVSPKQDNSFYYQKDMNQSQNSSKVSYSRLPNLAQNCLSPSSPKPSFHTPKTPSSLTQYQEKPQDYSVWSNGTSSNQIKLPGTPYPSNGVRFYSPSASMTPPPSASFKITPLSVITNGMLDTTSGSGSVTGPIGSPIQHAGGMLSPSHMFAKNQFSRLNESLNLNQGTMQDDLNTYLKHQFYGSPVTRQANKFDYRVNSNKLMNQFDYSNTRTQRFNSNTELSNNSNVFYQRTDLLDDLNSSKSPSSTSSGPVHPATHFSNTSYQRSNNSHHNQHQHTWAGRLPPKTYSENSIYSRKVFLGGLPWDVNQQYLIQLLQKYGSVKLEIPGKDQKHPRVSNIGKGQERSTPGYVYIIFEHESAVQRMLADCRKEIKNGGEHYFYTIFIPPTNNGNNNNGNYYFNNNMSNKRGKAKEVEVIPWNQEDTSYVPQNKTSMLPAKIDAKTTIFVGALHGMLNAHGLAKVMNEVFGEVIHAGLDTDKYKYPIGSGRVTFRNRASYVKAIKSKFVTIKANLEIHDPSPRFEKTIQIDPYLEDAKCFKCNSRSYYFCRNENCLDYYCENCWKTNHDMIGNGEHLSLSRQNKPDQTNKAFK